ncbi:MAG TPA: arginine deiminase-related protein [Cyclobacteriaceae bacterium]|nr:arginine deiminase-related protein [Cyclobacteriaceae bacterium]
MNSQAPGAVLMIRPLSFGFNPETGASNAFQADPGNADPEVIHESALREFNRLTRMLRNSGVVTHVFDDTLSPRKPDAVFPNNWVSFHHDGTVVLYPMLAPNRRLERRLELLGPLVKKLHFNITRILDLTAFELEGRFLEGTGSVVFDYVNNIAYSVISPRTDRGVLSVLCRELGFREFSFSATDRDGRDIYHTNVVMCIGTGYVIICLDAIENRFQQRKLVRHLEKSGLEIVNISVEQMYSFAGNMIELPGKEGEKLLVMSKTAYASLTSIQIAGITKYAKPAYEDIPTFEKYGGGSVRCMMAGIFLPVLSANP